MADPLHHSSDVPRFDTYSSSSGDVGLSEKNMDSNIGYQQLEEPILDPQRELESSNGRLNRTAEQIGGVLGHAVNQARRVPGSARERLHVVRNRASQAGGGAVEDITNSAASLAENAQQRARELADQAQRKARDLGDSAQQKARELMDAAEQRGRAIADRAAEIGDRVQQRASEMKLELDSRTRELRDQARIQSERARFQAQRIVREHPLETLGVVAGGAFALGVILRIVRSRNASQY